MRKTLLSILSALCCCGAFAQGEESMPFMRIDRNPATMGMAMAGSASSEAVAWSSFRNSAVLPLYEGSFDAALGFQSWAPKAAKSTNVNFGTAFKASEKLGFSLGIAHQGGAEYTVYSESGISDGSFRPSEFLVGIGAGVLLSDHFSLGLNLRYATQRLSSDETYSAFGADLNALYNGGVYRLTAGICNIGSSIKSSDNQSFSVPASVNFGGIYDFAVGVQSEIEAALDMDYYFKSGFTASLGVQYGYDDMLFARAGYHYGADDSIFPSFATLGIGVKYNGLRIDLAYLLANQDLANTITLGLGFGF